MVGKQYTQDTTNRKRGNRAGLLFFQITARLFGLSAAYSFLYPICLHYLIFDSDAVKKAGYYIDKRFPNCSRIKRLFHIYRLFISQGRQLIDRYAHRANPKLFQMTIDGPDDLITEIKNLKTGCILLASHIGNWQLGMDSITYLAYKKLHILMRPEDNRAMKEALGINSAIDYNFISATDFLGGTVEIMKALDEGDIISMMGDRNYGTQVVDVDFMGAKAELPFSAFFFAATAKCPVVTLYVVKDGRSSYKVCMSSIMYPKIARNRISKKEQLRKWVQEYANELATFTDKYPYQSFLFTNIWTTKS